MIVVAATIAAALTTAGPTAQVGAQDTSLPAEVVGSNSPVVSTVADSLPWGVVGIGASPYFSTDLRVPVFALVEIGDRIFVGGMFARAQRGSGGRTVEQPWLAAFDKVTGEMIESFRPTLDATVYALAATPDGKLIVGGEFTNVNGAPFTAGLAALNPITGAVDTTWRAGLERPFTVERPVVRALEVVNGWVYAGGNFSHVNTFTQRTRVYKAIKVRASNGELDTAWLPNVTGAGLWALAVSPDGGRVTLGGFHTNINGSPNTQWIGVVNGTTGATIPGLVYQPTNTSTAHIQAIADTGDKLYYSGSQHFIFRHNTLNWAREEGTTYVQGGDGQEIEISNGIIYNACHCYDFAWLDSYRWPTPSPGSTRRDVNGIAAYRQSDFSYVDSFQPQVYYENGDGPWDLEFDSRGCMWVGGDVFRLDDNTPFRWARGFTRLCRDDFTAPSTPTGLTATVAGTQALLSWSPATDDRGVTGYEVYRDGTRIATVTSTSYTDTTPGTGTRTYRVRALDQRGNKSATSAPVTATIGGGGGGGGAFACTVALNANGTATVTWNNIGATGYDVIPQGETKIWRTVTNYTDVAPNASYQIVAWGGGVSGTTTSCTTPGGGGGGGFTCTVTANPNGSVTVTWPNIGATGYDVIPQGETKIWRTVTNYTDPAPNASYQIVAWGGGVAGTTTSCNR